MLGTNLLLRPLSRAARYLPALFGAVIFVALAAIAMTVWAEHFRAPARASDVMLVYIGADDCAPCRSWQSGDGAVFLASEDFRRITYREVKSPHLHDVLNDENWPDDIRRYRIHLRRSDGVPLWLVVSDHEIVAQRFGETEWRAKVLPTIQSLLR